MMLLIYGDLMQYYPLFIDTSKTNILIIGAGQVASRKLTLLARTQAQITVIAPQISTEIETLSSTGRIQLYQREVCLTDIDPHYQLIYIATSNTALQGQLTKQANSLGIWVNVVDAPLLCDFITPAIIDRNKLVVAISTAGVAPVFASSLRAQIEAMLDSKLSLLLDFVAQKRAEIQAYYQSVSERRAFWRYFFKQNGQQFNDATLALFEQAKIEQSETSQIYIIDTLRPVNSLPIGILPVLQSIDQIVFDVNTAPAILEFVRRDAHRYDISELASVSLLDGMTLILAQKDQIPKLTNQYPQAALLAEQFQY
ncbi:precorrin-2 dehydrogenase/sirohydrochlorin ferrochelatase family protein [Shewanella marina]|uniref:precorrin-2 dehydrogenase/sirohydrochlorin ferrochelatase family protein n=1 Tax=Shewanella marina TaxID=487319 RepID=UPI000688A2CA|nr:bifunctional precorrin-2 dehydrogenase/sirohydrochlorin ferrochelatase [Shewanella marina]